MWKIFDALFPPRADELALRSVTDDEFLARLAPEIVSITRPATIALFSFSIPAVRAAIHEAKYHGSERGLVLLARALSDYLCDADDAGASPVLVPIPIGKIRRAERGFNQTEEIARRAAASCDVSIEDSLLIRTRETASQVSLPRREREKNMLGAFAAAHPADPRRRYVIVDDVLTTGATMQAAIDALTEAGAMHILPIALAH